MSSRAKSSAPPALAPRGRLFRLRPRVWLGLFLVAVIGFGARYAWQRVAPTIARHPQYVITAEQIHITPPPPWIRTDIKAQVLRDDAVTGPLSILDNGDDLAHRIQDAFEFHPWVASVERITKRLPSAIEVELKYRRPIAAVESADPGGLIFLPIDEHGIRLPEADLTDAERRYLPRISGVTGRPLVGDAWNDPRVVGGAKLAAALADVWDRLRLVEILCAPHPASDDIDPQYVFEIITSGGTRIVWGAAPGQETLAGESSIDQKRQRLLEYASQHGRLESIEGPAVLDVRSELIVTPRTARKNPINSPGAATKTK